MKTSSVDTWMFIEDEDGKALYKTQVFPTGKRTTETVWLQAKNVKGTQEDIVEK